MKALNSENRPILETEKMFQRMKMSKFIKSGQIHLVDNYREDVNVVEYKGQLQDK